MVVVYNTMGKEALNNVSTCMHYSVDRMVFVGFFNVVQAKSKEIKKFLMNHCGVKDVDFFVVPDSDLGSILNTMRKDIDDQQMKGNQIYFDISGGDSLVHVAFGILSKEYDIPIHMFNVRKDELIEVDGFGTRSISKEVPANNIDFDLDKYIEMRGGVINSNMHKDYKSVSSEESLADIAGIGRVANKHSDKWNIFTKKLQAMTGEGLEVNKSARNVLSILANTKTGQMAPKEFNSMLNDMRQEGIMTVSQIGDGSYIFSYKNDVLKKVIMEGGSYLELLTYLHEQPTSDDARIGVHIDWDGEIHDKPGIDVINEIDVLVLKGIIPTFISCKSGKLSSGQAQEAMFELEAVTAKFGGKFAKRVLVVSNDIGNVAMERAREMGIEVRKY